MEYFGNVARLIKCECYVTELLQVAVLLLFVLSIGGLVFAIIKSNEKYGKIFLIPFIIAVAFCFSVIEW